MIKYEAALWGGIEETIKAGFDPVKLNVILMKGINTDEAEDFVRLTFSYPLIVRFIEFFPTNRRSLKLAGLSIKNIKKIQALAIRWR